MNARPAGIDSLARRDIRRVSLRQDAAYSRGFLIFSRPAFAAKGRVGVVSPRSDDCNRARRRHRVAGARRVRPGRIEPRNQLARGVDAAHAQQLIAGGNFDEDRQVASRVRPDADQRPSIQAARTCFIQTEAIVLPAFIPPIELHDQLNPLRRAGRGHAKQVAYVDQPEAADFHVVHASSRARANHDRSDRRRTSRVVGPMRWPRTTMSTRHSLLPMPLSPAINTPQPRMRTGRRE